MVRQAIDYSFAVFVLEQLIANEAPCAAPAFFFVWCWLWQLGGSSENNIYPPCMEATVPACFKFERAHYKIKHVAGSPAQNSCTNATGMRKWKAVSEFSSDVPTFEQGCNNNHLSQWCSLRRRFAMSLFVAYTACIRTVIEKILVGINSSNVPAGI